MKQRIKSLFSWKQTHSPRRQEHTPKHTPDPTLDLPAPFVQPPLGKCSPEFFNQQQFLGVPSDFRLQIV